MPQYVLPPSSAGDVPEGLQDSLETFDIGRSQNLSFLQWADHLWVLLCLPIAWSAVFAAGMARVTEGDTQTVIPFTQSIDHVYMFHRWACW